MTLPAAQEPSPEKPQAKERTQESPRETAMQESQRERADLSLERQQEKMRSRQDIAKIDAIDVNKSPESQSENIRLLESVTITIIGTLLSRNVKKEQLKSNVALIKQLKNNDPIKKVAILKIEEILRSPDTKMFAWLGKWQELVDRSAKMLETAKKQKAEIEDKGKKWTTGKIVVTAALVAGGFYAGYKLMNWLTDDKTTETQVTAPEDEKKGGFWKNVAKVLGITGALGAVMIGACLIDPKHIGKWISDNLGVNLTGEAFNDFFSHILKGEREEALAAIFDSIEVTDPLITKSAKAIGIEPKVLLMMKDRKYQDFLSVMSSAQRVLEGTVAGLSPEIEIPFLYSKERQEKLVSESKNLAGFLKRHESAISKILPPPQTIEDVLSGLDAQGVFDEAKKAQEEAATEEMTSSSERLDENMFPSVSLAFAEFEKNGYQAGDLPELVEKVAKGTVEDGGTLVANEAGTFLIKGDYVVCLTTIGVVSETFMTAIESIVSEDKTYKDVLETYFDSGGKYLILVGGAIGGVAGGLKGVTKFLKAKGVGVRLSSALVDAAGGTIRGAITAPLEVIRFHGDTGLRVWRESADKYMKAREIMAKFKKSPEQVTRWARARARFHAEIFKKYYEMIQPEQSGTFRRVLAKTYGRIRAERMLELMERHGRLYVEAIADFNHVTGEVRTAGEGWVNNNSTQARRVYEEALRFLEWERTAVPTAVGASSEVAPETAAETPTKGPKLSVRLTERLKKLGISDELITRMQERFHLRETQIRDLISEIGEKADSKLKVSKLIEVLKKPEYAKYTPAITKALTGGLTLLAAVIIVHGYENTEDKAGFIIKTGAELGAFWAGAKATEMTVGKMVTHPAGRLLIDLGGGIAGALGVGVLWNSTGGYMLDRYYPDRDVKFTDNILAQGLSGTITILGWATLTDPGEWVLEQVGLQGGVDEETDPIAYLQDIVRMIRPFGESGDSIFKDMPTHTISDLEEKAQEAIDDTKEEIADLQKDLTKAKKDNDREEIAELEEKIEKKEGAITKLTSLVTGSWVRESMARLALNEELFLTPAQEEFRKMADAKFKGGGEKFDQIMRALDQGQEKITDESANQVWKYLVGKSIKVNEAEISFRDFILSKKLTNEQIKFAGKFLPYVEKKQKPEAPDEGGVDSERLVA